MSPAALNDRLVALAEWLMPPVCIVCGGRGAHRDLCHACALALPWNRTCCARCALPLPRAAPSCGTCSTRPPPWTRAVAPLVFEFPVDNLLRELKFSRRLPNGLVLGQLLAEWLASTTQPRPDLLLPVPLHWRRQLKRQFNQAAEIAHPVGKRLGIPVDCRICRRRRRTPPQRGLAAGERRRNLRDAFVVHGDIAETRLALIDDVMTTGSTLAELSRLLLQAGAASVEVWTVARVAAPGVLRSLSRPAPPPGGGREDA